MPHRNKSKTRSEWTRASTQHLKDARRGHAAARGYNYRWQKYTHRFLATNPLCIACGMKARLTDHILPVTQGDEESSGQKDDVFWPEWNHEPLCVMCHIGKTAAHDKRLMDQRRDLIRKIDQDAEDTTETRNQLLRLAVIWPRWLNLETGEWIEGKNHGRGVN